MRKLLLLASLPFLFSCSHTPTTERAPSSRLVIFGGVMSKPGIARFVRWATRENEVNILNICWASATPQDSCERLEQRFQDSQKTRTIEKAPDPEELKSPRPKKRFLNQISQATGIFFSGGDQSRIMKVMNDNPDLEAALRAKFKSGAAVFGGSSAGTAIMSRTMITSNEDTPEEKKQPRYWSERGFGLLPESMIVDQHFETRNREGRLKAILLKNQEVLGMGVDEDNAVAIFGNTAEVVGPGNVSIYEKTGEGKIKDKITLTPGMKYDLVRHEVLSKP